MIKITKDLKFGYADLMREVDRSQGFTLRDLVCICINSSIPMKVLNDILRCRYIEDYWKEINEKSFGNPSNIDYLELYWLGNKSSDDLQDCDFWGFHGVGKEGVISEDVEKYCNLTNKQKKEYREAYAVEFSKLYTIADLPIKIKNKLKVNCLGFKKNKSCAKTLDYTPSITLVGLLYAVFYELSFCGSPKERDAKLKDLAKRIENNFAKEKMLSHKQVKERILKSLNRKK